MFNPLQFYELGKQVFLRFTQEFSNVYWKKLISGVNSATVTDNAIAAPDGTITADRLYNSTALVRNCIIYEDQFRIMTSIPYTLSVYAKASGLGILQIFGRDTVFGGMNTFSYANFDLVNGIVTSVGVGMSARIALDNNGWYRCLLSGNPISRGTGILGFAVVNSPTAPRQGNCDPSEGVYIWGAKIEKGTIATDYKNEFTGVIYTGASPL